MFVDPKISMDLLRATSDVINKDVLGHRADHQTSGACGALLLRR